MTPLERVLLEALEGIYPLAVKSVRTINDRERLDRADDAMSLAHRTAAGRYHHQVAKSD